MNGSEVMDINAITKNFEFHGSTSVIALFDSLRKVRNSSISSSIQDKETGRSEPRQRSLISDLHNDNFLCHQKSVDATTNLANEDDHSLYAMLFIDVYFNSLHLVQPILDKDWFLKRCNDMWSNRPNKLRQSFKALYFSVLCLGACIRSWTEQSINGMNKIEWTRLLFGKAENALGRSGTFNDLEAVQAPLILSQVCLHQMDLNLAYSLLGIAIRTALSTGINRKVLFVDRNFPQDSPTLSVARTWWALYNIEIELCFILGRPNTLGSDEYHNRPLPPIDQSENAIIAVTHQLSQIIRKVSVEIYLSHEDSNEKLQRAFEIERELDQWLIDLPVCVRPTLESSDPEKTMYNMGTVCDPYWQQLQRFIIRTSE
jgi:Fungal specific transcription factor domain